ncbi:flagellar filament capping protein FliD [Acetivibrio clariflavus]|uniref:Flagellar hook-associated protein 2 n=1 Tax=Acetivibrio clariflavus (strain DSM 19732 / NBRC 101661 / EBR45) TaxID=720554 RepID=G8LSZ6_ACECE|nr:flagellar filament capping protein FliD [Acetivibrio clariflavus]AEV70509.1 flagellar capping protein [Acetivibrio clariflavus DSM 19732]
MAVIRITGTYSGLDTDKIIADLMKVERIKVDKVYKQKQLLEWKRDAYREISSLLMGFCDEYLNVLKTATNFRSPSAFAKFNIQSSNSSAVTATANADAANKTHTIQVISLASAAKITGSADIVADVKGSNVVSDFNLSGKKIAVTLDGVTKTLVLDDYSDEDGLSLEKLETDLEQKLADAFGTGKFDVVTEDGKVEIKVLLKGSTFSLSGDGLEGLGFTDGDNTSNGLSLTSSLYSIRNSFKNVLNITDPDENVTFTINGKTIDVKKSYAQATVKDIMNAINSSDAGVKMTYDSLNKQFILESTTEGAASNITYTDSASGLLESLGIVGGTFTAGKDAEFTLDGVEGMKRSSNKFTIDGVTYTLKEVSETPVTISVQADIDSVIENIKGFVNKYNELLDKINGKLSEKYDRNYLPLTEDEKDAMSEKEIEKWEEKAKTGLLAGDSILSRIVSSLRTALYEKIDGVSISLYDIGITTGSYTEKGRLKIDENKLRDALTNNFDEVVKLFTTESRYTYREGLDDSAKRTERYKQSGLAHRLYDIIQDNVRTTRDSNGKKGILLEKAGYTNDASEYSNYLYTQIKNKETLINTLENKLLAKENEYYRKFSAMEKILSQMQSQLSYISAITGNYYSNQ